MNPSTTTLRRSVSAIVLYLAAALIPMPLGAWGSKTHSQILDKALVAVAKRDKLLERLGDETWRLRYYAQMSDWWDCFISASEDWTIRSEGYDQTLFTQFYGNDYLIFPGWPGSFYYTGKQPEFSNEAVLRFHKSSFFRALQALRTENAFNASRWIGNLVHEVEDGSAPPHVWRIPGDPSMRIRPNAAILTRLEFWVDASRIDLAGYEPRLLGDNDEAAAQGLIDRAAELIEFTRVRTPAMMPLADANDRPAVETATLEIVAETARVVADVIHTLLALSLERQSNSASLIADISAPAVTGMEALPAKLVLMGTSYSTLSEPLTRQTNAYLGRFTLHNMPPGEYRGFVERVGARTLPVGPFRLRPSESLHLDWKLEASDVPGNLFRNPDFQISWAAKDAPDHWALGGLWRIWREQKNWVSDNTPVRAGERYRAGIVTKGSSAATVKLEWMEEHWKPLDEPPVVLPATASQPNGMELVAPGKAIYARCIVEGSNLPGGSVQSIFLTHVRSSPERSD